MFLDLGPQNFIGTLDPTLAEGWIKKVEKAFKVPKCLDEQKVSLALYILKGEAKHWWEMEERTHGQDAAPLNWSMCRHKKYHFVPLYTLDIKKQHEVVSYHKQAMLLQASNLVRIKREL